ncbi:hypothetical protein [Streptomyces sp. cmx-18-6]|uniref:hypothetical protein n=1 Tax=Streptomyces sp. cmx-18-6 TaxID=2790930 RepID=UPI00397FE24E
MSRRRPLAELTVLSVIVFPLVLACSPAGTGGNGSPQPPEPTKPATAAPAPTAATGRAQPAVARPPALDDTETVVVRQDETRGNRILAFGEGRKGDALIVAASCRGEGTVDVTVKPVNVTFPLTCVEGEVTTTYNQLALRGAGGPGAVTVRASSAVRWSLTIGRGEPAAADLGPSDSL